ncbi:MAG: hypothetical protein IPO05_16020 [Flavobacteriales bacterium]|jgi:hypothetical protein|nr:hypothetical protein [Flavobacteriales bacterium]
MKRLTPLQTESREFVRLEVAGKTDYLNKPEHIEAIARVDESVEEARRRYEEADRQSTMASATVVLK